MKKLTAFLIFLSLLLQGCGYLPVSPWTVPEPAASSEAGLTVYFLDVGQADCALLECRGEYMLIDGGNIEDGRRVVSTLSALGVQQLSTVVCSHAHEDHVGGLPAVLAVFPAGRILSPTRTYRSDCFDDFLYYADQQDVAVTIPAPGDTYALGDAEITVMGPVLPYAETNNTSLVLRVTLGESDFLFTGDMETEAEVDLLEYWDEAAFQGIDVLKVGHHGSDTSTGYRFLYTLNPDYGVISVGTDNTYDHPSETVLSRLLQAGCTVFRTDTLGSVTAFTDGSSVRFTWENQAADPTGAENAISGFIGNRKSHVLHLPTCSGLPAQENQAFFGDFNNAMEAGYTLCSRCMK